jgi:predicted ATP-grasp superfamily ATP-dependent carboligase
VGEKNDLLSIVASDDIINCIKHLVEYLSCRVFGQVIYRYMISISHTAQTGHSPFQIY